MVVSRALPERSVPKVKDAPNFGKVGITPTTRQKQVDRPLRSTHESLSP